MKNLIGVLCGLFVILSTATMAAAVTTYKIIPLGEGNTPIALNNSGQIAIEMSYSAYLWQSYTKSYLGDFRPTDINSSSQVVGYRESGSAYMWDGAKGLQSLGTLDGLSTRAWGLNDLGQVVGDAGGQYGNMAFIWDSTNGMNQIVGLTSAAGINSSGQVAGRTGGETTFRAVLWENGTITNLGSLDPPYSPISWSTDINESGNVVGVSTSDYLGHGPRHAFFWSGTGEMLDLGSISDGDLVMPYSINNVNSLGQVVGSSGYDTNPFIWEDGTSYSLNDLIVNPNGWVLYTAFDINDSQWIVGKGNFGGYLAIPVTDNVVPLPGTVLLLGSGMICLAGLRKKVTKCDAVGRA